MLPGSSNRARPLLIFLAVTLVASALISGMLFFHYHQNSVHKHSQDYGLALANLAARQAVDATLNHDLVSLQVILTDVAQNAEVVGATIHDVENRLLVQGGHLPGGSSFGANIRRSFTAPITLQDSVAGYVTVTLSLETALKASKTFYWQLAWGIAVLLMITGAILNAWLNSGSPAATAALSATDPAPAATASTDTASEPMEADEYAEQTQPEQSCQVRLSLEIHNLSRLRTQLNRSSFLSLLERFEQQLQGVQTLYRGELQVQQSRGLELVYSGESPNDCSFRALCSAQLLLTLTARCSGPQLQLSASILPITSFTSTTDTSVVEKMLTLSRDSSTLSRHTPHQVFIAPTLLDPELEKQVHFTHLANSDGARLEQIKPPYCELLVKQEQQLLAL